MSFRKIHLSDAVKSGEHGTYQRHLIRHCEYSGAHTQDYFELFWVEKGPGMHWINGVAQEVAVGTLQLIRPEDAHGFFALPGRDFEWTNVAFFPSSWKALRQRYYSDRIRYFDVKEAFGREFHLPKDGLVSLRLAIADLARGARDRLAFERFLLNALALLSTEESPHEAVPGWLYKLDQELRQQANFSSGVARVVALAGRCPEHVCREYRRYFGRTPTATMTSSRMEYASLQLETTDIKILDLALDIGFQNLGHFYRTFEKHFYCTPREYRLHVMRSGRAIPPPQI
jgi:AraC-like DNA-binding protein